MEYEAAAAALGGGRGEDLRPLAEQARWTLVSSDSGRVPKDFQALRQLGLAYLGGVNGGAAAVLAVRRGRGYLPA